MASVVCGYKFCVSEQQASVYFSWNSVVSLSFQHFNPIKTQQLNHGDGQLGD
jgi:hypothetical protein